MIFVHLDQLPTFNEYIVKPIGCFGAKVTNQVGNACERTEACGPPNSHVD